MQSYVNNAMKITKKLGLDNQTASNSDSNSKVLNCEQQPSNFKRDGKDEYSAKETLTLSGTMSGMNSKHMTNDEI